ncbi:MAG: diguanylate cyclase [Pseudomonadota bacterium]
MFARALFSFSMPGGLLVLAAVVLFQSGFLANWLPTIVRFYPYAVLGAGILLGWRFNRSRLVFGVLALTLAERSLLYYAGASGASTDPGRMIYNIVATLLPLNLAAISLANERGILTFRGIWRMGLILWQPLAIAFLWRYGYLRLFAYLEHDFFTVPILNRIPIHQPALLSFGMSFLVLLLVRIRRGGAIESGFFWALVSTGLALVATGTGPLRTLYFSTAGLILFISVIEASYSMAFRDELTGLPARRAMNEALLRLGSRYTISMVDIDYFKKFNDRYGHDVGDQVLRMVASRISKVAGGGKAFRYGGEEFSIIFPGKDVKETVPYLEQLRKSVALSGFGVRGRKRPSKKPENPKVLKGVKKQVSVTISIGVSERRDQNSSPQDVVKAADKALYRAKRAGRNRISI